ncbi:hypothetical protein JXM67_10135 [candidate division WOR-3 bacterium]|nr:hypothetical protein [candidate division WOR-3 bacterium]
MSGLLLLLLMSVGFSDPGIPGDESLVYLGYDQENQTSREIIRETQDKGDYYYSVHEHRDTTRIVVKCKVRKQDLSTIQVIKNRSGRFQLGIEQVSEGILVKDGFKDKQSKTKHSGHFYDRHTMMEVFRGFPFDDPETVEFPFFEVNLGIVVTGTCTYRGVYNVKTSLGEIRCHKLTLGFKSKLIDTAYKMVISGRSFDFYYETEAPHRMIYWTDNKGSYIKLLRIESENDE